MLNSTKTWQEEFDEQFIDVIVFDSKGSYYKKFKEGVELINIYKFISDLIAKTREETVGDVENVLYEAMDMGYSKRDIIDKINKLKK